jgi:hypothetical protein
MSTQPLAALAIQPQPDALSEVGRILQIGSLQNQQKGQQLDNQEKGLQVAAGQRAAADDAKWRAALADPSWDGTPEQFLKNGLKQGVGPGSYNTIAQTLAETQKKYADAGDAVLKLGSSLHEHIGDQLQNIQNAKPEDKLAVQTQAKKNATDWVNNTPGVPPAMRQSMLQQIAAIPDDAYLGDDKLSALIGSNKLQSGLVEDGLKRSQANEANARAGQINAQQSPNSPLFAPTPAAIALGNFPGATAIQANEVQQAGAKAGAAAKAEQPYKLQLEQIRQQVGQQLSVNKDARDKIEANVLKPYEEKQNDINAASSAINQAAAGNVAAARASLYKLIGVSQPTGTHRVMPAEVEGFSGMGGIPQRVKGSIANALSGDPWTPEMTADIKSFLGAQKGVADENLNRGIDNVNKLYNTSVGGGLQKSTAGSPAPSGMTRIKASDGNLHDIPTANLDKARKIDPGLQVVQ